LWVESTHAKLQWLRVRATGVRRPSGVPKGAKAVAKLPGGGHTIRSLAEVCQLENLPQPKSLAPGERRMVKECGCEGFVAQISRHQPPGEGLKADAIHLVEVADAAVDDRADAAQRSVDAAVDFAPKRPDHPRLVEVLHHHDLRPRHAADVGPILAPGVWVVLRMLPVARLADDRHGVADHRPHRRHEIASLLEIEAVFRGVVPGDLLPTVVDGGRVPALKLQQFGVSQPWLGSVCLCHLRGSCGPR